MKFIRRITKTCAVRLEVVSENDNLAVTVATQRGYDITHKPTGYRITSARTRAEARKLMKLLSDIDWEFGHEWTVCTKSSFRRMARNKKWRAAARALSERGLIHMPSELVVLAAKP